ncbi:hypothetical protein KW794_02340, partial [Candidatus Saccharibacteria bacterium]|nr:hypothetical protein [Candidatus Saccharibacteria bacterium]
MEEETQSKSINVEGVVKDILNTIDREREREIIARRFGLFDRRETLEQIGELLGITRERVRQLEKAVITKLRSTNHDLPHIKEVENVLSNHLAEMGKVARVSDISGRLSKENSRTDQSRVAFLANLSPNIAVIDDNDHFFHAIGLATEHTEKGIRDRVNKIIETIKGIGEPTDIQTVANKVGSKDAKHIEALATISKNIATLNGRWGLVKWPMVNPKNIRDKIYVILHDNKKPMHFNEIA